MIINVEICSNLLLFIILEQRQAFESKRKAHYNEFMAAKMAKKLIEDEEEEVDEEEEKGGNNGNVDTRTPK